MRSFLNHPARRRKIAVTAVLTMGLVALAAAYNYQWTWTGDVSRRSTQNSLVSFGRSKTMTTSSGPAYFEFVTAATANGPTSGVVVRVVNTSTGAIVFDQFYQAFGGQNSYYNGYIPVGVGNYQVSFYARSSQGSTGNVNVLLGNTYLYWY